MEYYTTSAYIIHLIQALVFLDKQVRILPLIIEYSTLRRYFYVNLYGQIASRITQNLQHKFLNMGSPPPPLPPLNNV